MKKLIPGNLYKILNPVMFIPILLNDKINYFKYIIVNQEEIVLFLGKNIFYYNGKNYIGSGFPSQLKKYYRTL